MFIIVSQLLICGGLPEIKISDLGASKHVIHYWLHLTDVDRLLVVSTILYDVTAVGHALLYHAGADPARVCLFLSRWENPHSVTFLELGTRGSSVVVGLGLPLVQLVEVLRHESVHLVLLTNPVSGVMTLVQTGQWDSADWSCSSPKYNLIRRET